MSDHPIAFEAGSVAGGGRTLASVRERFGGRAEPAESVRETYLDTFDWLLHQQDSALSATEMPSGMLLTWRSADGRLRHRLPVPCMPDFVSDLPGSPMRDALASIVEVRRMLPVARIDARQATLRIEDDRGKTVARLILEHGTVEDAEGGSSRGKLAATVQLVPLRGYDGVARRIARYLENDLRLRAAEPARLIRVLAAVGRAPGGRSSKLRLKLDPALRAARSVRQVLRALLGTIRLNEDGVRRDLDTEFLHDFRVSVRRTRSALGQIKGVLPASAVDHFRSEFGWLGRTTNLLRDLDVQLLSMPDYRAMLPEAERGALDPFAGVLGRRREAEQQRLVADLDSERYRTLVREWSRFLERAPSTGGEEAPPHADRPIVEVAAGRIRRAHRKVLARGRAIDDASTADALHALRIDCKKLRYLLEFFAGIFSRDDVARLVKALKRLQDNLGRFNDLEVQGRTIRQYAQEMASAGELEEATADALIDLLAAMESRRRDVRKRFAACFTEFDTPKNARRVERIVRRGSVRRA